MGATEQSFTVRGETFVALAERALYWPERHLLAVADLHWGKVQTFRHSGIPIPLAVQAADLERLRLVAQRMQAKRILVLGDMIHHKDGLTDSLHTIISSWRRTVPLPITLIRGNHDRWLATMPSSWDIDVIDDYLDIDEFRFSHHPKSLDDRYVWSGHIHPAVSIESYHDRLKMPCFHVGRSVGVLPAFSEFTGSSIVPVTQHDQIFAICEREIIAL